MNRKFSIRYNSYKIILSLFAFLFFILNVKAQPNESACPISKKEAYIIHIKHDSQRCKLSPRQNEYILKVRQTGNLDEVYEYTRRLNYEVGVFED